MWTKLRNPRASGSVSQLRLWVSPVCNLWGDLPGNCPQRKHRQSTGLRTGLRTGCTLDRVGSARYFSGHAKLFAPSPSRLCPRLLQAKRRRREAYSR